MQCRCLNLGVHTLQIKARYILLVSVSAMPILAQNPEAGITLLSKTERLLRIDSYRPLDSAAYILASNYQISISSEDPPFACPEDVVDTQPGRKSSLAAEHAYVPKGSSLEVRFSVNSARYPLNSRDLLDQVVAAYNQNGNFQYRLQREGDFFSFVPTAGRDTQCHPMRIDPLLDQIISVPAKIWAFTMRLLPSTQR